MDDLLSYNFHAEVAALEKRCGDLIDRKLNDLHEIFGDTDDGLFTYLLSSSLVGHDAIRETLPTWASREVRQDSTGAFSLHEHVLDATWFWRTVRSQFERITGKPVRQANVVDYGAGWGRISRFANKDVPAQQFFALEPNPVFRDIYQNCKLPGTLIDIGWSSDLHVDLPPIDLIFSYSILTHSSADLTKNIIDRWAEMTSPGSVVAFTIRPGCYYKSVGGDMDIFNAEDRESFDRLFDNGELIYKGYPGSKDWGVTIMSEQYLENILKDRFDITLKSYQPQTKNQLLIFAVRK